MQQVHRWAGSAPALVFLSEIRNPYPYPLVSNHDFAVTHERSADEDVHILSSRSRELDNIILVKLQDLPQRQPAAIYLNFDVYVEVGESFKGIRCHHDLQALNMSKSTEGFSLCARADHAHGLLFYRVCGGHDSRIGFVTVLIGHQVGEFRRDVDG